MPDDIQPDLRSFIAGHIHSVAKLELLLLLQQSPDRSWSADDAARALYIARTPTEGLLNELVVSGLVAAGPAADSYRYAPRTAELNDAIAALEQLYRERRVTVITLIHSAPVDKLRNFADAFRFFPPSKES